MTVPTVEQVEAVARALWAETFTRAWDSVGDDDPNKRDMFDAAKAAIAAYLSSSPAAE